MTCIFNAEIMKNYINLIYVICTLMSTSALLSCASTQENFSEVETHQDFTELLAVRARPSNATELKYECQCMDGEIKVITDFSDKMSGSRFSFLYQSLGREKIATINSYKTSLNCQ